MLLIHSSRSTPLSPAFGNDSIASFSHSLRLFDLLFWFFIASAVRSSSCTAVDILSVRPDGVRIGCGLRSNKSAGDGAIREILLLLAGTFRLNCTCVNRPKMKKASMKLCILHHQFLDYFGAKKLEIFVGE